MITHGIVLDTITNRIFTRIGWQWGWQWEYYEQWLFVKFFYPIGINAMLIGRVAENCMQQRVMYGCSQRCAWHGYEIRDQ